MKRTYSEDFRQHVVQACGGNELSRQEIADVLGLALRGFAASCSVVEN